MHRSSLRLFCKSQTQQHFSSDVCPTRAESRAFFKESEAQSQSRCPDWPSGSSRAGPGDSGEGLDVVPEAGSFHHLKLLSNSLPCRVSQVSSRVMGLADFWMASWLRWNIDIVEPGSEARRGELNVRDCEEDQNEGEGILHHGGNLGGILKIVSSPLLCQVRLAIGLKSTRCQVRRW